MKHFALISPLAVVLSACATAPADSEPDVAAGACDAAKAQFAVGQVFDQALGEKARIAAGARALRDYGPGQPLTMDYRLDRLNIERDAEGRVKDAYCG